MGDAAAFVQAILPGGCRLVVAAPGKRRRGQDVAGEPYVFGGHEYKLLSNVGHETGEERDARIDREELAKNGSCLTLAMVRALAEEIPGPTDGDSGDEKVGLLGDAKVAECVEERSPLTNSPGVEVGQPIPQKVRPIERAREARVRRQSRVTGGMVRALGDEIPGPTDGDSVGKNVGVVVDSRVVGCLKKRSPLSNSPGVEFGRPLRHKVRPIEKAREARARRERQSKLLEARQPTATFELENPPDPPQFLEELTPSAGQTKSAKVFVSPGLGKNQSAMSHLWVDVLTTH